MSIDYVHGYSAEESTRLSDQATTLSVFRPGASGAPH